MPATLYRFGALSVLLLMMGLSLAAAGDDGPKGKKKDKKGGPHLVQVDLNRLPPPLARQLRDYLTDTAGKDFPEEKDKKDKKDKKEKGKKDKKGKGKKDSDKKAQGDQKRGGEAISLIDAIRIAERSARGVAVKADRKGEPGGYHFKVDVLSADGDKTKVELDGNGHVLDVKRKGEEKKEEKKRKGKDK